MLVQADESVACAPSPGDRRRNRRFAFPRHGHRTGQCRRTRSPRHPRSLSGPRRSGNHPPPGIRGSSQSRIMNRTPVEAGSGAPRSSDATAATRRQCRWQINLSGGCDTRIDRFFEAHLNFFGCCWPCGHVVEGEQSPCCGATRGLRSRSAERIVHMSTGRPAAKRVRRRSGQDRGPGRRRSIGRGSAGHGRWRVCRRGSGGRAPRP